MTLDPASLATIIEPGSKVRCRRTGEIGTVTMITEISVPKEEVDRLRGVGVDESFLQNLPPLVLVETDPDGKSGIIRSLHELDLIRAS